MSEALLKLQIWIATARRRPDREAGASLVEYALLIGFIAIVCFVAIGFLGGKTSSQFESTGSGFPG